MKLKIIFICFRLWILILFAAQNNVVAFDLCHKFFLPNSRDKNIEKSVTKYLNDLARDQWKFYVSTVSAETNYLPPDNVTIEKGKPLIVDYRTSPTNIGLYMLSTVTAQRLGYISQEEAIERLNRTIATIKKLPKYKTIIQDVAGKKHRAEHLYNWYSINGKPAEIGSGFISTVDNGNFAASLIAIISAIGDSSPSLVREIKQIVQLMRFDILYDADENLLYHGAQVANSKLNFTAGHYDMLISEARSAYVVAILLKQIPQSAWTNLKQKLGTELSNTNNHPELELQSYTGTMFEYLTSRLFMKHNGTPLGKADQQALKFQMRDAVGGIWGKSESNSNTSRGYAAWGNKFLAQSREFTSTGDDVIAPYASQMAVGIAPEKVVKNLRQMDILGLRGPFGHFESVTIKRNEKGSKSQYLITPQFYAHHIGMGFISLANHLDNNLVQGWFHASLYNKNSVLEDLLSTSVNAYRPPLKKIRSRSIPNAYAYEPKVNYNTREIIGNGEFVAHVPGIGGSTWLGNGFALSHNEVFYIRDNSTASILPLKLDSPNKVYKKNGKIFFKYQIPQAGEEGYIDVMIEISVSPASKTKVSRIIIDNKTKTSKNLQVTGYLDWILDDINAYLNHPVYRNLYTITSLENNGRIISARRRTMQGPDQERQPYGFFALGGGSELPDWADSSRTNVLGRLGNLTFPQTVFEGKSNGEFGATLDPAAALAKNIIIKPYKSAELSFILGFVDDKKQIPNLITLAERDIGSSKSPAPKLPSEKIYERMRELFKRTVRGLRIDNKAKPDLRREIKPESIGYWSDQGRKFIISEPFATKKPWAMVVSNGKYGFVATQSGWAYSFGANSQQSRVTPYAPDITTETPLRGVIVKDKRTGEVWSITPKPAYLPNGKYEVEVSPGYIKYLLRRKNGIRMAMTMFVARNDPLEFWQIEINNDGTEVMNMEISSFIKWALGANFPMTAADTRVRYDSRNHVILAQSSDAISPSSLGFHTIVGNQAPVRPNSLFSTKEDPFSGLTTDINVAPGEKKTISFLLGLGENDKAKNQYLMHYKSVAIIEAERKAQISKIENVLDGLQVNTPDKSFNKMLNTWLPYQAYYAHYLARSGYYQSGGAFGFRDQLQTVMNLISSGNEFFWLVARAHIIESSKHQFEKGDVQHWWHPHNNLGQRSTISDNLLWLPFAISHYIEVTGDSSILKEYTPFSVASRDLKNGELDFVESMVLSKHKASLFEHAKRAIDLVLSERMGEHGLPLIGKGDWNDGLDRIGHLGKGESVWLGFFLYDVLNRFARVAQVEGEVALKERYLEEAEKLKGNLNLYGWDKTHFIRAYTDSGEKIKFNDAIVQAWSVLSKAAEKDKGEKAIKSAIAELYKPRDKIVLLFDQVLNDESWGGSLAAYPPGIRENNAQYTHGSSWLPRAVAKTGDGNMAYELYKSMLPTTHASNPRYGAEPYAVAADIYGGEKVGEGGWSWYSGAPGWIYRTGIDSILGIEFKNGNKLFINPTIPSKWEGYEATYRRGKSLYKIKVENPNHVSRGVQKVLLNGFEINKALGVPLIDDGKEHFIRVIMESQ